MLLVLTEAHPVGGTHAPGTAGRSMQRIRLIAVLSIACLVLAASPTPASSSPVLGSSVAGAAMPSNSAGPPAGEKTESSTRIVVRGANRSAADDAEQEIIRTGGLPVERTRDGKGLIASVPPGRDPGEYAEEIAAHVSLQVAEVVGTVYASEVPTDERYPQQWGLPAVNAPTAWDRTWGDAGVVIAIIDSGVDLTHPDLANQIQPGGYDWIDNDAVPNDVDGHGTHVAGIAAAQHNNIVFGSGIAPECRILPLRVLKAGNGSTADVSEAIRYAADHGADVINMSLGTPTPSEDMRLAVQYALGRDVVVVAASGNSLLDPLDVQYPAAEAGVLAVGAVGSSSVPPSPDFATLSIAPYSNRGPALDLVAPGTTIWSTYYTPSTGATGTALSGTSMATPFVAGVAALVRSAHPGILQSEVITALTRTARDLGVAGRDDTYGFGLVDAEAAIDGRLFVYRFHNTLTGAHFYTASAAERLSVASTLGHIFRYEGVAYALDPSANSQPLHRFYNVRAGTHFYTASDAERASVQSSLPHVYTYEGVAYGVTAVPSAGEAAVYRFYNARNGTHFYTADPAERDTVIATLWQTFTYEGPAFYLGQ